MMFEWVNYISKHNQPAYFSNFDLYSKLRKEELKISDICRCFYVDRRCYNTLDFHTDGGDVLMIDFDWIKDYYNQQQSEGLDLQMCDKEERDDV